MKEKILIVDDETDIVSMLKDYFEFNGYYTITATNGLEAIKKAVISGLGVSVISTEAIKDELKEGKLKTFTMPELVFKRQFNIVYHKNKFIPPEMQEVIDECLQLSSNK